MKKIFSVDELQNQGLPYAGEMIILDTSRWDVNYQVYFTDTDGSSWRFNYSEGATEMQDYTLFDEVDEVECTLVERQEVMTTAWVEV